MTLIKCKECGKEVSDKAEKCPNCGCQVIRPFKQYCSECGNGIKENETILEWNQSSHKLYNQNFRDGIFYMLCYFKRKRSYAE